MKVPYSGYHLFLSESTMTDNEKKATWKNMKAEGKAVYHQRVSEVRM